MSYLYWQRRKPIRYRLRFLSRCQRYDFHRRISIETIIRPPRMELMQEEKVEVEERAIRYVAKAGRRIHAGCTSAFWTSASPSIWDEKLTYDHVLEVLGAVDTESLFEAAAAEC